MRNKMSDRPGPPDCVFSPSLVSLGSSPRYLKLTHRATQSTWKESHTQSLRESGSISGRHRCYGRQAFCIYKHRFCPRRNAVIKCCDFNDRTACPYLLFIAEQQAVCVKLKLWTFNITDPLAISQDEGSALGRA